MSQNPHNTPSSETARSAKRSPNRMNRRAIAEQTLAMIEQGWYENERGERVDLGQAVDHCRQQTRVYTPSQLAEMLAKPANKDGQAANRNTTFTVTNETTLSAARRMVVEHGAANAVCLNFASAKNPGGGFLGGSQAQEESLARSSALYAAIEPRQDYYEANRRTHSPLYTDHMILSPAVPVFRTDDGALLDEAYTLGMLTAPAVNAGALSKRGAEERAARKPTMDRRVQYVLEICRTAGYQNLILGAWGCGVFRNDPREIAQLFGDALLRNPRFAHCFAEVTFAVLDHSANEEIITPFRAQFCQTA